MNIMKVLAKTKWGADYIVLLRLYRTLIRSRLDYGRIIYDSARKSYKQMLDSVRLALGAFRTSPVQSLYIEANELSLQNRRLKLSLQYAVKIKANKSNPAYSLVFNPQFTPLYESKPKSVRSFGNSY